MDCRGVFNIAIFSMLCFASCNLAKKHDLECLLLNDSRVVNNVKFHLATKIYEENDAKASDYIFLKVYVRVSDAAKNKSFLFAAKDVNEYNSRYSYLSFNANKDFLLKIDTAEVLPIGYNFLPSNEVSNYDELIYSFRLEKKRISDLNCNQLNIQYWYMDHIAGTGNVCFRPQ